MSSISIGLPTVTQIQALGLPFFVAFLVGMALAYVVTEKVYLSIGAGICLGAIALIITSQYPHLLSFL